MTSLEQMIEHITSSIKKRQTLMQESMNIIRSGKVPETLSKDKFIRTAAEIMNEEEAIQEIAKRLLGLLTTLKKLNIEKSDVFLIRSTIDGIEEIFNTV